MKYELVIARKPQDLERLVNQQIALGWEPLGGPVLDPDRLLSSGAMAQAMIRNTSPVRLPSRGEFD